MEWSVHRQTLHGWYGIHLATASVLSVTFKLSCFSDWKYKSWVSISVRLWPLPSKSCPIYHPLGLLVLTYSLWCREHCKINAQKIVIIYICLHQSVCSVSTCVIVHASFGVAVLLWCAAMPLGIGTKHFKATWWSHLQGLKFPWTLSESSWTFSNLEDETTTLSLNIKHQSLIDMAPYSREWGPQLH